MEPSEVLKRPYSRVLVPDQDGRVTAEILEFPNCVAFGENAAEALSNLEEVAEDWIATAIEQGQDIPEPMAALDYSGRLVLRMTKGLHQRAARCADREGVSLNQFIVTCLAECVGEKSKPQLVAYPVQAQMTATVTFLTVGTSAGVLSGTPGRNATRQITARTSGPAVLPVPQWRELEREHA